MKEQLRVFSGILLTLFFLFSMGGSLLFPPEDQGPFLDNYETLESISKFENEINKIEKEMLLGKRVKDPYTILNLKNKIKELKKNSENKRSDDVSLWLLRRDFNELSCFVAVYKNTILWWVDKSVDIENSYSPNTSTLVIAKMLPPIFVAIILYFWTFIFSYSNREEIEN